MAQCCVATIGVPFDSTKKARRLFSRRALKRLAVDRG
jgi:hypothetical protein